MALTTNLAVYCSIDVEKIGPTYAQLVSNCASGRGEKLQIAPYGPCKWNTMGTEGGHHP